MAVTGPGDVRPPVTQANPLRPGEHSERVKTFQLMLTHRGFVVPLTGTFDKPTESAYHVAQHALGREKGFVTCGPVSWTAISRMRIVRHRKPVKAVTWRPKVLDCRHGEHGMVRHRTRTWEHRPWSGVRYVLGHYTGNLVPFTADAAFHVNSDYLTRGGAPAIAYTLGIDKDGVVYVFNEHDDLTWHCDGGKNAITLGIVFQGNEGGMNLAQRRALRWLLKALRSGKFGYGFPPAPSLGTTHQHVKATSCPGVTGEAQYRSIFAARGYTFDTTPG